MNQVWWLLGALLLGMVVAFFLYAWHQWHRNPETSFLKRGHISEWYFTATIFFIAFLLSGVAGISLLELSRDAGGFSWALVLFEMVVISFVFSWLACWCSHCQARGEKMARMQMRGR